MLVQVWQDEASQEAPQEQDPPVHQDDSQKDDDYSMGSETNNTSSESALENTLDSDSSVQGGPRHRQGQRQWAVAASSHSSYDCSKEESRSRAIRRRRDRDDIDTFEEREARRPRRECGTGSGSLSTLERFQHLGLPRLKGKVGSD